MNACAYIYIYIILIKTHTLFYTLCSSRMIIDQNTQGCGSSPTVAVMQESEIFKTKSRNLVTRSMRAVMEKEIIFFELEGNQFHVYYRTNPNPRYGKIYGVKMSMVVAICLSGSLNLTHLVDRIWFQICRIFCL